MASARACYTVAMVRIAIVGDIHGHWSPEDVDQLDHLAYDAVVVVGDLAGLRFAPTLGVARGLAQLTTRTIVVPGNHDATHPAQLLAEVTGAPRLGDPLATAQARRLDTLKTALGPCELGAYSLHRIGEITLVAARPHSMGGPTLSFAAHLHAVWGIDSLEASARRLCALVDEAPTEHLVFVGHNGPTGLGDRRDDIWGCDFRRAEGDWGDADLRAAIDHARETGRRVAAVCAGHMHRRVRGGGQRTAQRRQDGTLYVNAAEVPRVREGRRHHVALELLDGPARATDRWVAP